jgi:hypothetical protein
MDTSWYATSYRKLFFDFHSPGTAVGLAAGFDAERWAERVQAANAQAVSVFTKCGFGYSFYRRGSIRYVHPQLPEGLDMLAAQLPALHRRGIKAIGYYHTFNSEPIARDHPDWLEREADGRPRGISCCLLSPLFETWMLPHVEEIVTLYDVDAMFFDGTYARRTPCYCAACRARFAQATGGLELPTDEHHPAWREYVAWALAEYRRVRQAICEAIHRHRPGLPVSFNWAYTPRMPEVVPAEVGNLVADIPPEDQCFNGSYLAHYWALMERPFDIMNSAFLQWWGDWGCKPALAMQQEVATAIANGGLTWIGYQMNEKYDVEPAVMAELGKTLAFVQEREPLLVGAQPIPTVAVLHTTQAHLAGDPPRIMLDETSLRGAHRALVESMIPYHTVHEETLLQRLDAFQAVILPDQRYLAPELVVALERWVHAGGVLLATAQTGTLDAQFRPTGRLALGELLGLRYEGLYDQPHAYIEVTDDRLKPGTLEMPHLVEAPFVLARPVAADVQVWAKLRKIYLRSDGQFLLRWSPVGQDSGYPAITVRQVGRGWAVYLAGEVFRAYQVKNQWNVKHIVANLLRNLVALPVQVAARAWLEVVLMRQVPCAAWPQGRTLVHLVNHHSNRPVDKNYVCAEQVLPVREVKVRLRLPKPPQQVTLEPGGSPADWDYAAGWLLVMVPEVYIHRAVVVEETP